MSEATWSRFDRELHRHPRFLAMSKDARLLFLMGVVWSRDNGLAGHLDRGSLRGVMGEHEIKRGAEKELIEWKWATPDGHGGIEITNYSKYNPLTDAERKRRQRAKEAQDVPPDVTPMSRGGHGNVTPDVTPESQRLTCAPASAPDIPTVRQSDSPVSNNSTKSTSGVPPASETCSEDPDQELILGAAQLLSGQLSETDKILLRTWPVEYRHLSTSEQLVALAAAVEHFASTARPLKSVKSARTWLQEANAAKVDGELDARAGRNQSLPPGQGYGAEDEDGPPQPTSFEAPSARPGDMRRLGDVLRTVGARH